MNGYLSCLFSEWQTYITFKQCIFYQLMKNTLMYPNYFSRYSTMGYLDHNTNVFWAIYWLFKRCYWQLIVNASTYASIACLIKEIQQRQKSYFLKNTFFCYLWFPQGNRCFNQLVKESNKRKFRVGYFRTLAT